jgi:hypothetical protein
MNRLHIFIGSPLVLLLVAGTGVSGREPERGMVVHPQSPAASTPATAKSPVLTTVEGEACYEHGDSETFLHAQATAKSLAKQHAIESHRVFVESTSKVENFQLTEDMIKSLSRASLHNMKIFKEQREGQKICMGIRAQIDPAEVAELINQKVHAKEVAAAVQHPLLSNPSAFKVKVWTNKDDGTYRAGDRLIVYVQSEKDAYLKVDYYQANGKVVHLVPNLFGQQAFIHAGEVLSFGGKGSPFEFVVAPPYGSEAIKVLASTRPIVKTLSPGKDTDDSSEYLGKLREGVRGLELRPKGPSSGTAVGLAEYAEAAVAVVTVEKE